MAEITFDADTSDFDVGDTLFVLDLDAVEYRETTVERAEQIGYSTKLEVEASDRTFGMGTEFDHAPGEWAMLARPQDVETVADALAEDTGADVTIIREED